MKTTKKILCNKLSCKIEKLIFNIRDNKCCPKHLVFSIAILFSLSAAICGLPAQAAEISIDSKTQTIAINQEFQIDIFLNTEGKVINAVQGKVLFPDNLLELKEVRDGNSIINFWIERPIHAASCSVSCELVFSGITPGGYQGERGLIFSLIFVPKKDGEGTVKLRETKALLNDGLGTPAKLVTKDLNLVILSDPINEPSWTSPQDVEMPEKFVPEIARNHTLFDNKWFLAFATQDKGSGISHYEIKETRQRILVFSKWIKAESPYILQDQELSSYIFVKTVDRSGNERVMKIAPRNPLEWYANYENWIIIIICLLLIAVVKRKLWRKRI